METRSPNSEEEFSAYYQLRWEILRKPWDEPVGSEKDEREDESLHVACFDGSDILGVGRLHLNSSEEAQVRYMAVSEKSRGLGVGGLVLEKLEQGAKERGASYIVLEARKNAVPFYKNHGYGIVEKTHILFGSIQHFKMKKIL